MLGEGPRRPEAATSMAHVWNDNYGPLYDRTYRVLYDAGINEKLADKLATQRTLAAALSSRDAFTRSIHQAPARTTHLATRHRDRS